MKNNLALVALFGIFCALPVVAEDGGMYINPHYTGEVTTKLEGLCQTGKLDYTGSSKGDDEYLYENLDAYTKGIGLECDFNFDIKKWPSKCSDDKVVVMQAGHYYNGQKQSVARQYTCKARAVGNDIWRPGKSCDSGNQIMNDDGTCTTVSAKSAPANPDPKPQTNTKPYTLLGSNTVQELVSKQGDPCTAAQLKQINATAGVLVQIMVTKDGKLQCSATKCIDGFEMTNVNGAQHCRKKQQQTKPATTPKAEPTTPKFNEGDPCPADKLLELQARDGFMTATDSDNPICIPTICWDGAYLTMETAKNSDIRCVHPTDVCGPDQDLEILEDGIHTSLKCLPKQGSDNGNAGNTPVPDNKTVDASAKKISAAYTEFGNLTADLKRKKWRNEDGKFNTARLASDGVAGVVLGTTAGLVTAHVVKKGQIKNGYEDIKCTIGGQEVSDWGDELTVGIR